MNDAPRLSIVLSTFNCAETLQTCLDSIFAQTYPDIELIVADGGSNDGTVAIIEANADRIAAWKSAPDKGIYDAWNAGLKMVTGDWVYFIGADDTLYDSRSIEMAMTRLGTVPSETMIAYGQIQFVHANGRAVVIGDPWIVARRKIHAEMSLPHPGTFHRRALFAETGGFDDRLQIAGDYKVILQSLEIAEPVFLDGLRVCVKHAGGVSELRRNRLKVLREVRKVQADLGYPISWHWLLGVAKGVVWFVLTRTGHAVAPVQRRLFRSQIP